MRGSASGGGKGSEACLAMRLSKHQYAKTPELNMTPMIDVVFQLLIFFMTCSQVANVNLERLDLPTQKGSEDQGPTTLTVNITRDGVLRVSGRTLTTAGLVEMVSRELDRLAGDASRIHVVVRADERGQSRAVNDVVAALSGLGIYRLRLAVEVPR